MTAKIIDISDHYHRAVECIAWVGNHDFIVEPDYAWGLLEDRNTMAICRKLNERNGYTP